jgi:hypothetical protein
MVCPSRSSQSSSYTGRRNGCHSPSGRVGPRTSTTAIAVLLTCALSLSAPMAASAACDPHGPDDHEENRHAYAINTAYPEVDGVTAYIYQYRPFVPFELFKTRASSAWVMLHGVDEQWAQVGWLEYWNWRKTFVQWTDAGGGHPKLEFDPEPDWTYTQSTVLYEPNANGQMRFRFFSDNVEITAQNAWWDPQDVQVGSEIHNLVLQMPGDLGATHFQKFHTMRKRTSQWWPFAPTLVSTSNNQWFYASNARGGMDPLRELVTADKRGDCAP